MIRVKGFIFTNKEYSRKGIMSTILGVLSCITIGAAVFLSCRGGGESSPRYGAASLLAAVFMLVGLILGIYSTTEKDKFKLFSVLGMIANILAFGMLSLILFAGAYVD